MQFEEQPGDGQQRRQSPRWWWFALGLAGIAVVALSWMAPEPQAPRPAPASSVQPISFEQCIPQEYDAPSYGTRSVSDTSGPVVGCLR